MKNRWMRLIALATGMTIALSGTPVLAELDAALQTPLVEEVVSMEPDAAATDAHEEAASEAGTADAVDETQVAAEPVPLAADETATEETASATDGATGMPDAVESAPEEGMQPVAIALEGDVVAEVQPAEIVAVQGIALDSANLALRQGECAQLTATISPAEATNPAVRWESTAPDVATVADGQVQAVAPGSAVIRCISVENEAILASCAVQVEPPVATAIIPGVDALTLGVKEKASVSGWRLEPSGAQANVTYESSAPKIATVEADGTVTAKRTGTAQITIRTDSGASCQVSITVKKAPGSVKLSLPEKTMGVGDAVQAKVTLSSKSAGSVTFSSSNGAVATVDANGQVCAVGAGSCTITVKTYNGRKSNFKLTVKNAPTTAQFSAPSLTLGTGDSHAPAMYFGDNVMARASYASSNPAVASVDASTGRITANAVGECTISVETYNHLRAECHVTVVPSPQSVSLSAETAVIGIGETLQLNKQVLPEGADGTTSYKSSRKSVLTVDANGLVHARRAGTATITATCYNGVRGSIKITVRRAPKSIQLTASRTVVGVGESVNLSAKLTSGSAGHYALTSSDEGVLPVSGEGTVMAQAVGRATVTATTFNGKRASLEITVCPEPTSISLADVTAGVGSSVDVQAFLNAGSAGAIAYSVADPAIASIDASTGRLTAKAVGTTMVTARAYNGVSTTATVTVKPVPTYIRFPERTVYVGVGDSIALHPEYDPDCETTLSYKTSSKKYATVSAEGVVQGVRAGKCTITVKTHNGRSAKVTVMVLRAPKSLTISDAALTLGVGERGNVTATLTKNTATTLRYEPSDPSVVTVDASGALLGVAEGVSDVTVRTHNGLTAQCRVTVVAAPTGVTLSAPDEMGVGQTARMSAALPEGSHSVLAYSVVSGSAVTVSADGELHAVAKGTAVVRVSTHVPGVYAEKTVTVYDAPGSMSLASGYSLNVGEQLQISPSLPEGTRAGLSYSVLSGNCFSVDESGLIQALRRGTGQVQVKSHNGLTTTATVTVYDPHYPETAVFGEQTPPMLMIGEQYTPVVSVTPASAQPDFAWTSSNPAIASVDGATGTVTAVSPGMAYIQCVSGRNDGLALAYCVVVSSDSRCLVMPERRTDVDGIEENLKKIAAVEKSALQELDELYARGVLSKSDYQKRRSIVQNAFAMYAFPWMTEQYQVYWNKANSEEGAKDYKPGIVYYGLPYTQKVRNYNVDKALSENRYLPADALYYLLNTDNLRGGTYCGNDCSSFVSMAIWGMGTSHSADNTRGIATTDVYKTISSAADLRPGDLLNRSGKHVVMFLYFADAAKTQMVIIEQGGGEAAINTCSTSIRNVSDYIDDQYKIRRLSSLR